MLSAAHHKLRWPLLLLPLLFSGGCSWNYSPQHGPVDRGTMRKLSAQVQDPLALGFLVSNGVVAFPLDVQSPDTVTLPMMLPQGMPVVPVSLNDRPHVPMIFDTGAQRTVLDARTAIASRVALLDPALGGPTLAGSLGQEQGRIGLLMPIQLGSFKMSRYVCLVRTHHNVVRHFGNLRRSQISLDILGMDMPRRILSYLTLDYPGAQVKLGVRGKFQPQKGARVWKHRIIWRHELPHITLKSHGTQWLALVDSGFSEALEVDERIARSAGVFEKRHVVTGGYQIAIGGSQPAAESLLGVSILPLLQGMGPAVDNVPALITRGRPKIGSGYMKHFTVTLDFARHLLWVEDRARQ